MKTTRDDSEVYEWTGFDPNKWDHYHHAGQQVRFYRTRPWVESTFEEPEDRWYDRLIRWLFRK